MPDDKTVSVVMPCYNAARYVGEAIESVLAQSYPDVELIVVDDGSSDGSPDVVARYADRGVRLIAQPNRGAAAARNRGFGEATGRYILFMDADDLIDPGHLEALHERLDVDGEYIAFGQWDRFVRDPGEARFPPRPGYRDADPVDWLIEDWRDAKPMTQSAMFLLPRLLIERFGGWDETLGLIDDFEFFTRMIANSAGLRFAAGAKVFYRSSLSSSLSGRTGEKAAESALSALLKGTDALLAVEDSARTRRAAANMLRDFDHRYYPHHSGLRARARARARELGGGDIEPGGSPNFHRLRRLIGWKAARRVQLLAHGLGILR